MKRFKLMLMVSLILCGRLAAQDTQTTSWRDPAGSTLLSLGATVVPMALGLAMGPESETGGNLFLFGLFLGPATGYLLTDEPRRGLTGIGVRGAIAAAGTMLFIASCSDIFNCSGATQAIAIATMAGLATSAVLDIVKVRRRDTVQLSLAPKYFSHTESWGIRVSVDF